VVRFLARGGIFALLAAALFVPGISEGALAPRALRPIGDARQATPFAPSLLPSTAGSPVDCVILTPDSLADLFQRLADFQTRSGRPTVVRSLATVRAADPRSNDLPQAIRSFLKSARDLWGTRWAILGGDHDAIPLRTVRVTFGFVQEIPTDAYYADLDGTWDGNGNGIYGEVADDLDMQPDIAVGRLSAATRADATAMVDKALRYAGAPFAPMLSRQLVLAEVLLPQSWSPGQSIQWDGAAEGEALRATALKLFEELRDAVGAEVESPELEDPELSFAIARRVEIDARAKQSLLESQSEPDRLEQLISHLRSASAQLELVQEHANLARRNGNLRGAES